MKNSVWEAPQDILLDQVIQELNNHKYGFRIIIPYRLVLLLLNVPTIKEAYELMGCGRAYYGVGRYGFCADKEIYPPETKFYIGCA